MSIEAMKLALEALERGRPQIVGALVQQDQDAAITALRTAIEQAEKQEPVECMCGICKLGKREWVGLTDEEIRAVYGEHHDFWGDQKYAFGCYERDIEAKLKEKNT
jgi:hypothetical protein